MLKRILSEGFRTFFLLAVLWAILSVAIWELWLAVQAVGGDMELRGPAMAPHQWHAHEMIFGYSSAAVAGFLLTAILSERRVFLAAAAGLWIAGRLAFWFSSGLPAGLVAVVDLAFLPVLGAQLLRQVLHRRMYRHLPFLSFVAAMTLGNLLCHLGFIGHPAGDIEAGQSMGLLALCGLIGVLGGRVSPGFVRNAMKRSGVEERHWPQPTRRLDRAVVGLSVLLPWLSLWPMVAAPVAAALSLVLAGRLRWWRPGWTLKEPLLWSLIVGQGGLVAGLMLWALAQWQIGSEVAALHVIGLGAVGGMTIAVMSRATLGHTGRPLQAPGPVAWGYGLVLAATLLRWAASTLQEGLYFPLVLLSGAMWIAAFVLFITELGGALTGPRVDRPPVGPPPGS